MACVWWRCHFAASAAVLVPNPPPKKKKQIPNYYLFCSNKVLFTLLSIIGGGIYFTEFAEFDSKQAVMFPLGVLLAVIGVIILSLREMRCGPTPPSLSFSLRPRFPNRPMGSHSHPPPPCLPLADPIDSQRGARLYQRVELWPAVPGSVFMLRRPARFRQRTKHCCRLQAGESYQTLETS